MFIWVVSGDNIGSIHTVTRMRFPETLGLGFGGECPSLLDLFTIKLTTFYYS